MLRSTALLTSFMLVVACQSSCGEDASQSPDEGNDYNVGESTDEGTDTPPDHEEDELGDLYTIDVEKIGDEAGASGFPSYRKYETDNLDNTCLRISCTGRGDTRDGHLKVKCHSPDGSLENETNFICRDGNVEFNGKSYGRGCVTYCCMDIGASIGECVSMGDNFEDF